MEENDGEIFYFCSKIDSVINFSIIISLFLQDKNTQLHRKLTY